MVNIKTYIFSIFILFFTFNLNNSPRIYVNSVPKCGTHLLTKCITLLTNKKERGFHTDQVTNKLPRLSSNEFFHCHIPYSKQIENLLKIENYKVFFIYRDPRDQIISHAYWIKENPRRYLGGKHPDIYSYSINKLINIFINNIKQFYNPFLPWIKSPMIHCVKFEDLVGANGADIQKEVIKKISLHININSIKLDTTINNCVKKLFGGTDTFRKGKVGEWKKYLNESQKNNFKKIAGQLLIDLGYEKDFNW